MQKFGFYSFFNFLTHLIFEIQAFKNVTVGPDPFFDGNSQ